MTTPAVEMLRRALPHAYLAMMVGPWSKDVAERDPLLDELLTCSFPGFSRKPKGSAIAPYSLLRETASWMRQGRYDAALVLRYDHWWGAMAAALAGIPVRVGYSVPECAPFLTHSIDPSTRSHWTEQGLNMVEQLLRIWRVGEASIQTQLPLRFSVADEDEREAGKLWAETELVEDEVVALHPGAGSPAKLWPEARWAELGSTLAKRGLKVVITGSHTESAAAERLAQRIPGGRSIAGRTGFATLAAFYRRCRLVVGVDSGPLHLAVAVKTPTVHLFGPADPAIYGPWGDPELHRVVIASFAKPCGRLDLVPPEGISPPCMEGITVEQVIEECELLLSKKVGRG
ncbi:MAG: glycosyltransferase family 9 protein [Chloroflexota bacterium]